MRAHAQTINAPTDEVDMEERLAVLETDVAYIKAGLNELRGKMDAANDSLFKFREEARQASGTTNATLERKVGELRGEVAELRTEMRAGFGEVRTEAANTAGDLRKEIATRSGELEKQIATRSGELEKQIATRSGELEKQVATRFGELEKQIATRFGELQAALEKAVGTLTTSIERHSGENRKAVSDAKVWWLTLVITMLGGAVVFLARALKWI